MRFAVVALVLLSGCPDRANRAVAEWAVRGKVDQLVKQANVELGGLGGPRDLPEVDVLQGDWSVAEDSPFFAALGLQPENGVVTFDGTHLLLATDARLVLYAFASPDEASLAAAAWLVVSDGRTMTRQPYCVRITSDGDDVWRLALSFDPTPVLREKAGDERPGRALPIRAAADDPRCPMQAGAPTLVLRRP